MNTFLRICNIISSFFILALCFIETCCGIIQLFGNKCIKSGIFVLTGTFNNSGPYGGFLAVCISIICAELYSESSMFKRSKTIHWSVKIVSLSAIILLLLTQSRSGLLALGFSSLLYIFRTGNVRKVVLPFVKKYSCSLLICITILCTALYFKKKPSADGRFFMEYICMLYICQNGLKGAGHGCFGAAYGNTQASYFQNKIGSDICRVIDLNAINEHDRITADCPDNPFNEYLFVGVEYGLPLLFIFITLILLAIFVSARNRTNWCYGMISFAVFAFFSYPLHVKEFQLLFLFLLLFSALPSESFRNFTHISACVLIMTVLFFVIGVKSKVSDNSKCDFMWTNWQTIKTWYEMEYYEYIAEECDSLLRCMHKDEEVYFICGHSLNIVGRYEKSDSILLIGSQISSDPMFWNVMGNNSLALGRYSEAEERYKHAFYMVPNRLYPLTLLAKLYDVEGDTVRFLKMADTVESFVPKVESVNTERLRQEIRDIKAGYIDAMRIDE